MIIYIHHEIINIIVIIITIILSSVEQFPGVGKPPDAVYSEELLVGYR